MSLILQERLSEVGCAVLNYENNKIVTDMFYNETMYNKFLSGSNCRLGMGLYDDDEELQFNKLNDGVMVIVQQNGTETERYKYIPLLKTTMEYKNKNGGGKKINGSLTFKIRKNVFNGRLNLFIINGNSIDFENIDSIKDYLSGNYGEYKNVDWSVIYG